MTKQCPRCGSDRIGTNGIRRRKSGFDTPQLICKDCHKQFVADPLVRAGRPPQLNEYSDDYWCKNHPTVKAKAKGLCPNCYASHRWKERKKLINLN